MRSIFVTGGNAGIGLALCHQLLVEHGCHVFMGSRSLDKGRAALASLALPAEAAARCTVLQLDTTCDVSIAAAKGAVQKALRRELESSTAPLQLYALVNNAGTGLGHGVTPAQVVDTNLRGPKRIVDAFLPLLDPARGRIVMTGSGSGPSYIKGLGPGPAAKALMNPTSWEGIEAHVAEHQGAPTDSNGSYGLSKACLTAYTMVLAKQHPSLKISVVSPGYILTKMTAGYGATKPPAEGTVSLKHGLFGDLEGSGFYYGSDAVRSPLHFMRSPGEPAYEGVPPPEWS